MSLLLDGRIYCETARSAGELWRRISAAQDVLFAGQPPRVLSSAHRSVWIWSRVDATDPTAVFRAWQDLLVFDVFATAPDSYRGGVAVYRDAMFEFLLKPPRPDAGDTTVRESVWAALSDTDDLRAQALSEPPFHARILDELPDWSARHTLGLYLTDRWRADPDGAGARAALRKLWTTPPPPRGGSADVVNPEQEEYDYWWIQGFSLEAVLGEDGLRENLSDPEIVQRTTLHQSLVARARRELE